MFIAALACTVNTWSWGKNNEASDLSLLPGLIQLEDIKWCWKPRKVALQTVFSANINSSSTTELIYVPTEVLRLQSSPVQKLMYPVGFFPNQRQFSYQHDSSTTIIHFIQLAALHHQLTPRQWSTTNLFCFAELPFAIQEQCPPLFSNILAMPLLHPHKGLYTSFYHQRLAVITLMYQPTHLTVINYQPACTHRLFNGAALTIIYQQPTISPWRTGASTMPLQLKHIQTQQLLAAAILPP